MATAVERLRQSFILDRPDQSEMERVKDALLPRYLFSAILRLDCRYEPCGFQWVEPGEIHVIKPYPYLVDNTDRYTLEDSDLPLKKWGTRNPAVIARRIIEREGHTGEMDTGIVLLEELTGLDASQRYEDGELLLDLQQALLPDGLMGKGSEQLAWLESVRAAGFKGPNAALFAATANRMIQATQQGIAYSDGHYRDVINMLSQAAAGKDGHRNKTSREDDRLIQWAGYAIPTLASPMVQSAQQQAQAPAQAPAIPQVWCAECGTYTNLGPQGQSPKLCPGCGVPFAAPEQSEAAPEGETPAEGKSRRERLQEEAQARNKAK